MSNLKKRSILIVDDSAVETLKIKKILEKAGYLITSVEGGVQALAILNNQKFDGMLLDIVMPVMNGMEVLTYTLEKEDIKEMPILMMTGEKDIDTVQTCLNLGAVGYLTKPVDKDALLEQLNTHLKG